MTTSQSVQTSSGPRRVPVFLLGSALLFAGVPVVTLSPGENETQKAALAEDSEDRELRNRSAIAVILGDIRADLSDLVFIKTERYLHNGVAMMPHLDTKEMARSGDIKKEEQAGQRRGEEAEDSHDGHDHHHHDHGDGEHVHEVGRDVHTVIKSESDDFRGFIGNLERQVKPWLPPGSPDRHTSGTELLPWYRLATLSNPHNERAYMVGAWWLKGLRTEEQQAEALRFIEEGIANNPRSFQLYLMRGYLLRQAERDEEAMESFKKASELVIQVRPPEGKTGPETQWSDHLEDQATAAMTMALFSVRDLQSPREALKLAEAYEIRLKTLPPPIQRVKRDLEKMIEEEGKEEG